MSWTKEVLMREAMRRGHASRERFVCGQCLHDDGLAEFVADHARHAECEFCGATKKQPFTASLGDVIEHMAECICEDYADPTAELPHETREGGFQGEVLDAYDLLETVGFTVESESLHQAVLDAFSDQQWCKRDYFQLTPTELLRYGWDRFKVTV